MDDTLGRRIRTWRRRRGGMSQQMLADRAGISQGYLSKIEAGTRPLERRSLQVALAHALDISVAQLLGEPRESDDPLYSRATAAVASMRTVVVQLEAGERRPALRNLDDLKIEASRATHLRCTADHAALIPMLPNLVLDLVALGPSATPQLVEAVDSGVYALKAVGQVDLARSLVLAVLPSVQEYDVPAWTGQIRYTWAQCCPPESSGTASRVVAGEASHLQRHTDTNSLQMYGHLTLLAAMTAAVSLEADRAREHLREAEDLAASLGEPRRTGELSAGFNGNWFGPTNVALWRVAISAELGDVGDVLSTSRSVNLTELPVPSRIAYFWTDVARALAAANRDTEALHALAKAERAAPQHVRFNPAVRYLVHSLLVRARRRAGSTDLIRLARTLGLDPL